MSDQFLNKYKKNPNYSIYFCPGRVNLIGEHIDYNGGKVLPYAIEHGIYAAAKLRPDDKIILTSTNMDLEVELSLDNLDFDLSHDWANYPKGVMKEFLNRGYNLSGIEINYSGNIPGGAGLSSSAAIEVLTCQVLVDLNNINLEKKEWALLSQKVENEYIGVNCGIMDQFAVTMGKKNHAILLDCDTLEYEYAKANIDGAEFIIINSNKKRELADSKYNERRAECEKALSILEKDFDIKNLCELDMDNLDEALSKLEDPVLKRRVRHVVSENNRVYRMIKAMEEGNKEKVGKILYESHDSLKNDYEVTGKELDTLVSEASKIDGVYGIRMTGAGFGGSTIALVEDGKVENFEEEITKRYKEKVGLNCEVYPSNPSDGVRKL